MTRPMTKIHAIIRNSAEKGTMIPMKALPE